MKFSTLKSRVITAVVLMLTVALASLACAEEELPTATPVPLPPIVVDIGMTAITVMAPVNIDFEAANFTDGASYFWDFGDGGTSAGTIARHTYLDAGTFTVKLTASRGGETEISESTIIVQPGDAGWLVLNAEELTLAGAETFKFEIDAFDHLGNPGCGARPGLVRGPSDWEHRSGWVLHGGHEYRVHIRRREGGIHTRKLHGQLRSASVGRARPGDDIGGYS